MAARLAGPEQARCRQTLPAGPPAPGGPRSAAEPLGAADTGLQLG
jgi:hypothetical protein